MANISDTRAMANPARELDRKRMGESINEALDKLTPRERTVFELKHYQGLKLRTIGEMLSTTEETAKNTLFRATRKLRANLAELREESNASFTFSDDFSNDSTDSSNRQCNTNGQYRHRAGQTAS